jgi:cytochrome c biogenesis protein CcdA/thiol-disulfide isomerase/thioredoxin
VLGLALIGFVGGLVTGISPCILPVLPVIFFSGGIVVPPSVAPDPPRSRPYLVIAGLVVSFSLVTLAGSLTLAALGLPQDVLAWAGLIVLVLIGVGLIVPRFERVLERPFTWIPQRQLGRNSTGLLLGLSLGVVYVPCAGPVLAAITIAGSTGRIGVDTVVLTVAFAAGAAVPLLIFALAGRRVGERVKGFRRHQRGVRIIAGVVMIGLAISIVFDVSARLQRLVPDYTSGIQERISESDEVIDALDLGGLENEQNKDLDQCTIGADKLDSCGTAPDLIGIKQWFNTPGNAPVTLDDVRGKVVLLDFWAYSCINCQRSLPHVIAWYEAYHRAGLEVIGIHSPEYAFEKEPGNVRDAAHDFGIDYPVALDNNLSTWTNYRNRYWPAHYLIDAQGIVRHITFGEGDYDVTETMIRDLLRQAAPDVDLPAATDTADTTPDGSKLTPETYLGWAKQGNYAGERYPSGIHDFAIPDGQLRDTFALNGMWNVESQHIAPAGDNATIRLKYSAREVQMVLSGTGTITYVINGGAAETIQVEGTPNAYRLLETDDVSKGAIDVTVSPGVEAYSFTFG